MPDKNIELVGKETDPAAVAKGERDFDAALMTIQNHVDPAYSFIIYRFNRVGITHPKINVVCFIDNDGTPTLGVNYSKFSQYPLIAQIGIIEHAVGHFMSGHVGNKLGLELRDYCEAKYGYRVGRQLYYLVTEAVADSFVSYPGALREAGQPVYDVQKFKLERWANTLNVLSTVEDLLEKEIKDKKANDEEDKQKIMQGMFSVGDGSGEFDDPDAILDPADLETGGADVKDLLMHGEKSDAIQGEDKIREIIKQAMAQTKSTKQRGYMAGDAGEFVESDQCQPVVPWFHLANHSITAALSEEQRISKMRLNRRNPGYGFGRVYENTTRMTFIIDTSGSVGAEDLSKVNSQVDFLAQNADIIDIIHNDAGVARHEQYRRGMKLEQFFGRGGTDFEPALRYIRDELGYMPEAVIFFTDGYGGRLNDDEPIISAQETKLVWILTPSGMNEEDFREQITNIGDIIKVDTW